MDDVETKLTYGFLLRFELAQGIVIDIDKEKLKVKLPDIQRSLTLSAVGNGLISNKSYLEIRGTVLILAMRQ